MKLLYVEDNPRDADLARRELARHAPHVTLDTALTLGEARARLAENPGVDLVLADLHLPDGNGLELLAEIREQALPLAVVILTGQGDEDTVVAALKLGADDYLAKREDYLARLPAVIDAALARFRAEAARRAGRLRVLYAEHDAADIDLTRRHLERHAPHIRLEVVHGARDVLQRLPCAAGEPCPCDVLLLDYHLLGGNALEVLRALHDERHLDLPVVLVTGQGDEAVAAQALRLGASDYLVKHPNYLYELPVALENAHHRARLAREQDSLRRSEARFRGLVEAAPDAILGVDRDGRLALVNAEAERTFGYPREAMLGQPIELLLPERFRDSHAEQRAGYAARPRLRPMGIGLDLRGRRRDGSEFPAEISLSPLEAEEGLLVMATVHDITERKRAQQQIERQLQRLGALRTIDMAITASLDPRVTFGVILDQVTAQLRVDAADVLLYSPDALMLEFAAGRGFRTDALRHTHVRVGEGQAGRAALERRVVVVPRLAEGEDYFSRAPLFAAEGFVAYFAVPLVAKGQVKGVLEIFHRAPMEPEQDWLDFLEALAGQAAIAIDNAALFDGLQRSNLDLMVAYDSTIEGWSRALDLRDRETEGHTRRVTEMTLRLARAVGIGEAVLVHVRRGALLHDIGKMAVPDSILRKPGPLTAEERAVMERHPTTAWEMLSGIAYLEPALDIPWCHHERWDGRGYPRGLRGEDIPLAARIFALVDVWDALRSDRVYRAAWPEAEVRAFLRDGAGTQFDPALVQEFMAVLAEADVDSGATEPAWALPRSIASARSRRRSASARDGRGR